MSSPETGQPIEEVVKDLKARIEVLYEEIEKREATIRKLEAQNKHLIRQLLGPKSDRPSDEAQLLLMEIVEGLKGSGAEARKKPEETEEVGRRQKKRRKPTGRQILPEHLEHRVEIVDLPEEEKIDKSSGKPLRFMGYDERKQLVEEPAKLYVRVIKRAKYARPKEAQGEERPGVVAAPIPAEYRGPIEKCKAAVEVLATIIVHRFCYHMTYYRLQERYWRLGKVWLPRSTMCGWTRGSAEALEPICKEMRRRIIRRGKLGFDDTRVAMLDPGSGKTISTRLWSYSGLTTDAPYQLYDFREARDMVGPLEFLEGFRGVALGDALSTNKAVARRREEIELAGCWDHARRYFVNASEEDVRSAAEALAYIKRLYKIEREVEGEEIGATVRLAYRKEKAKPVLAEFRKWLEGSKEKHLPKSGLNVAVRYALNHWKELTVYLKDGEVPISNCLCEQSFKAIATGRKNWLFFGSEEGGRTAAILYSMIMTCRRLDIDPQKYLTDVLKRVNDHPADRIEELLPDRWKRDRLERGEELGLRLEEYRPLRRVS